MVLAEEMPEFPREPMDGRPEGALRAPGCQGGAPPGALKPGGLTLMDGGSFPPPSTDESRSATFTVKKLSLDTVLSAGEIQRLLKVLSVR